MVGYGLVAESNEIDNALCVRGLLLVGLAFTILVSCGPSRLEKLMADYRAGLISREEFDRQMAPIICATVIITDRTARREYEIFCEMLLEKYLKGEITKAELDYMLAQTGSDQERIKGEIGGSKQTPGKDQFCWFDCMTKWGGRGYSKRICDRACSN